MGRKRKYEGLYGRQEAYKQSEKGKQIVKQYESSEARRAYKTNWARKSRGTIIDRHAWFLDNYGDIETALAILKDPDQRSAIELYYGLAGSEPINQTAIAKILNKSQPKISKILQEAKSQLSSLQQADRINSTDN